MRWIKKVSLATLGALLTLAGLAGGTLLVVRRAWAAGAEAAPQLLDYVGITALITLFVVGFGLLVATSPQIGDDLDDRNL